VKGLSDDDVQRPRSSSGLTVGGAVAGAVLAPILVSFRRPIVALSRCSVPGFRGVTSSAALPRYSTVPALHTSHSLSITRRKGTQKRSTSGSE
jgi:hypothetical protein